MHEIFLLLVYLTAITAFTIMSPLRTTRMARLGVATQNLEFRPEKDNDSFKSTMYDAEIGAELSVIAEKANVPIAYQCRKGECGTCKVNMNGKWVKTCQTRIPAMASNEELVVIVKKIKKKPAKFFSPKSFAEGVFNNGLGVVGFIARGATSGKEFSERMDREKSIEELVAERKARKGVTSNQ
tara:strand:- start:215 stop:763 length:549 start_codon:yes stop_codon:yes gene_type:complete